MSASREDPPLFSIGIVTGGMSPQIRQIYDALGRLQEMIIREQNKFPNDGTRINLVFHIPGKFFAPDYEGVHAVRYKPSEDHILIVAAVPADLTSDEAPGYFADALRDAIREADSYMTRKHRLAMLGSAEKLVEHIAMELSPEPNCLD